jgi:hypothetical protein
MMRAASALSAPCVARYPSSDKMPAAGRKKHQQIGMAAVMIVRSILALLMLSFAAYGSAQVEGYYSTFFRADFYPDSIVQKDGLRRAWMRVTYLEDTTNQHGDITIDAHAGDIVYVFSEYDCRKGESRVENLRDREHPHGLLIFGIHGRAVPFSRPAPGALEAMALDFFCRPVAPHSAESDADRLWNGLSNPWDPKGLGMKPLPFK